MTDPNSQPIQPEILDINAYREMLTQFGQVVVSPLSKSVSVAETQYIWPVGDNYENDGTLDKTLEVGRLRSFNITSGEVKTQVDLYMWNERIGEVNSLPGYHYLHKSIAERGLPIGYVNISSDNNPNVPGEIVGIIELYQKNFVVTDFNHGTGPADNPMRQEALEKAAAFLGLKPELVTVEDTDLRYSNFDNQDLTRFTEGLVRLQSAGKSDINL